MKSLAVSWALALSLVFAGQRAHAAACPAACATCDGDTCLTCTGAALLVDGKCYGPEACLDDPLHGYACRTCHWLRPNECQECDNDPETGIFLTLFQGKCYPECADAGCSPDSCEDSSKCTACSTGYARKGRKCVKCADGCTACKANFPDACTACAEGYYKKGPACLPDCTTIDAGCDSCKPGQPTVCGDCKGPMVVGKRGICQLPGPGDAAPADLAPKTPDGAHGGNKRHRGCHVRGCKRCRRGHPNVCKVCRRRLTLTRGGKCIPK